MIVRIDLCEIRVWIFMIQPELRRTSVIEHATNQILIFAIVSFSRRTTAAIK